ncbi:hypothetical protein MVI01_69170 [Myxococcus virescens]|uniref:Uncharacterized protein n=3 Tax=Myxococcus TaxID=32 RepID=A0A511HNF8_9BACT|nr:hypothetical protein MVI01_69170 [Myxococcus virescens]SDE62406.1 hypothetical protein SAMN04488504_109141 [Myxococcus virescens]
MARFPLMPRTVLPLIGALALAAAFVFWLLLPEPSSVPSSAPLVAAVPEPRHVPAPATVPTPRPGLAQGATLLVNTPLAPASGPVPAALARPGSPLDAVRQRVMAANPDLAQFRHLQRKVLRKGDEQASLQSLFKDREVIDAAKADLLATGERTFSADAQFRRLYQVEFLGSALEWKDNPERPALLNDLEELLRADNLNPDMELELRRSLSGDKVELFMILLHNDRARAESMLQDLHGSRLGALLEHARTRYDALWALAAKQP